VTEEAARKLDPASGVVADENIASCSCWVSACGRTTGVARRMFGALAERQAINHRA